MDSTVGRTTVLSHGFWQRRFGTDPDVIGRTLKLDGELHTVVGVTPPDFQFKGSRFGSPHPDLYVRAERGVPKPPIDLDGDYTAVRGMQYLIVVGRLSSGVSIEQAKSEMDILANALADEHPDEPEPREVGLAPLHDQLVGTARPALLILLGAVGFVLLIACANVANLLLARATGREKEIAVRAALGASPWRLARQLLGEAVLLSLLGAAVGLVFALWCMDLVVAVSPENIPRIEEVGIDWTVLGFTLMITLFTGAVFGLLPALNASRPDLMSSLKEGAKSSGELRGRRIRSLLIACEVSLALVLLVGAGLMVKSFLYLQEVEPGFQPKNVLTMRLWLPDAKYDDEPDIRAFFNSVVERVESIPGVRSAAASLYAPLDGGRAWMKFVIEGRPETTQDDMPLAAIRVVSPNYFRTVGIPLRMGRDINTRDDADAPSVAVVNEAMARHFWPDESPIGKRISGGDEQWIEIVGVVGNVRHNGLGVPPEPTFYVPHQQMPIRFMSLVLRTQTDPMAFVEAVRGQVRALDADLPVFRVRTAEQFVAQSVAHPRFQMLLIATFAGIALLLAVVGIYGLIAYFVSQRVQAVVLTLVGVGVGLLAAFALTRVLASFLFGVSATDPLIFFGGSIGLALVAIAASYLPARRATRVDPLIALRSE
jgi:predicted permease